MLYFLLVCVFSPAAATTSDDERRRLANTERAKCLPSDFHLSEASGCALLRIKSGGWVSCIACGMAFFHG
jgi:hypothetical protein